MDSGSQEKDLLTGYKFSDGDWSLTSLDLPRELPLTLYINGLELVTILCTPKKLNCLVLGFLYNEGVISGIADVLTMRVCEEDGLADVRLRNSEFKAPERRTLTSGCGGGSSLIDRGRRVLSDATYKPEEILFLIKKFRESMEGVKETGGIHVSALADREKVLIMTEDIGRHNTIDKIQGECLLSGISTKDRILLTTGRISSEMVLKASMMEIPILVSMRTPTERAVYLGKELGICIVARARGNHFIVYSHPLRVSDSHLSRG